MQGAYPLIAGLGKDSQLNLLQDSQVLVIGSRLFPGDDRDDDVMWMRHDDYKEALRIISGTRQEHMNLAHRIPDDDRPQRELTAGYITARYTRP